MNHHQYADWLLVGEQELSLEQSRELHAHLEQCEQCRTLASALIKMESAIKEADLASPAPGFADRWQIRLEESKQHLYRRQILLTLVLLFGGLILLIGVMAGWLWPWLRSPDLLFYTWVYQLFTMYSYADSLQNLVSNLFGFSSGIVPWVTVIFGIGLMSEVFVLWFVSIRLFFIPRRVVR